MQKKPLATLSEKRKVWNSEDSLLLFMLERWKNKFTFVSKTCVKRKDSHLSNDAEGIGWPCVKKKKNFDKDLISLTKIN